MLIREGHRELGARIESIRWMTLIMPTACGFILVLYVLLISLPPSIVRLPGQDRASEVAQTLFPQGWAFFTKDADASVLWPYLNRSGRLEPLIAAPNASAVNSFGWSREGRNQGVEMASLLRGLDKERWSSCAAGEDHGCVTEASRKPITVTNRMPSKSLCGDIVLVAKGVTPWAYRYLTRDTTVPREALALRVACPQKSGSRFAILGEAR